MAQLRIGCVVMAAGNARRFGEITLVLHPVSIIVARSTHTAVFLKILNIPFLSVKSGILENVSGFVFFKILYTFNYFLVSIWKVFWIEPAKFLIYSIVVKTKLFPLFKIINKLLVWDNLTKANIDMTRPHNFSECPTHSKENLLMFFKPHSSLPSSCIANTLPYWLLHINLHYTIHH